MIFHLFLKLIWSCLTQHVLIEWPCSWCVDYWLPCIDNMSLSAARREVNTDSLSIYQTGDRITVHILLVQDPNEHMSHLYRFLFFFLKWSCSFSMFNIKGNSVWNAGWIFYHLFTQRNKDTRQSHVQVPHKYMPKCFFNEFTSNCNKKSLLHYLEMHIS